MRANTHFLLKKLNSFKCCCLALMILINIDGFLLNDFKYSYLIQIFIFNINDLLAYR